MDTQIQYNEALIDERDQGIAEITQQIGEVQEIFQVGNCFFCAQLPDILIFRVALSLSCTNKGSWLIRSVVDILHRIWQCW